MANASVPLLPITDSPLASLRKRLEGKRPLPEETSPQAETQPLRTGGAPAAGPSKVKHEMAVDARSAWAAIQASALCRRAADAHLLTARLPAVDSGDAGAAAEQAAGDAAAGERGDVSTHEEHDHLYLDALSYDGSQEVWGGGRVGATGCNRQPAPLPTPQTRSAPTTWGLGITSCSSTSHHDRVLSQGSAPAWSACPGHPPPPHTHHPQVSELPPSVERTLFMQFDTDEFGQPRPSTSRREAERKHRWLAPTKAACWCTVASPHPVPMPPSAPAPRPHAPPPIPTQAPHSCRLHT